KNPFETDDGGGTLDLAIRIACNRRAHEVGIVERLMDLSDSRYFVAAHDIDCVWLKIGGRCEETHRCHRQPLVIGKRIHSSNLGAGLSIPHLYDAIVAAGDNELAGRRKSNR